MEKKDKINNEEDKQKKIMEQAIKVNEAIIKETEIVEFTEEEKFEFKFLLYKEKAQFYILKLIEPLIFIDEMAVINEYNNQKEYFQKNDIPFEKAKEIVRKILYNRKFVELNSEEVMRIFEENYEKVEISTKEILNANVNPLIIEKYITNKIINKHMSKQTEFLKENEKELKIIENEAKINYFLDNQARKQTLVLEQELNEVIEKMRKDYGNLSEEDLRNKAYQELYTRNLELSKINIINYIKQKYNIE